MQQQHVQSGQKYKEIISAARKIGLSAVEEFAAQTMKSYQDKTINESQLTTVAVCLADNIPRKGTELGLTLLRAAYAGGYMPAPGVMYLVQEQAEEEKKPRRALH